MIKTINGWRAIFALIIVLFHAGVTGMTLMPAGVVFFLMASGFLLEMKHPFRQLDKQSYKRFVLRSASKLYPLHWLALILLLVILAAAGECVIDPLSLSLNVTLLQSWSLSHHICFSYNPFSWFLSTLLFCYLCFPLLSRWFMPLRVTHQLIIVGVLSVICLIAMLLVGDYGFVDLTVFPLARIIDFMIGMMLVQLLPVLKRIDMLKDRDTGIDVELGSVALLSGVALVFIAHRNVLYRVSESFLWWIPVAVLLLVCVIYDKREGFVGKFLASRPMQWLGGLCFEIFMLQRVAALAFNYLVAPVLSHIGFGHPSPFAAPGTFDLGSISPYSLLPWFIIPIDIVLAWIVNRFFTRPLRRFLSTRI